MRNTLPPAFKEQMSALLDQDLDSFLESYDAPRTFGLRLNPVKLAAGSDEFAHIQAAFGLEPIPWCPSGYYYREEARPGKHPYHAAGVYYLQEPSAMSSAELLDPQPGDTVLDLAAAPGGKTTQISAKIGAHGLLVANEIHPARALILSENVERMGAVNTIAVSAAPDKLADRFPLFFDKIMLDAPCSGEGMFRKDPEAISEWSPAHVSMCASRQLDIVRSAVAMLKPGGRLGYSTCTFNRQENEALIEAVLLEFPFLKLVQMERIWPHLQRGEGHFVAVIQCLETGSSLEAAPEQGPSTQRRSKGAVHGSGGSKSLPKQIADAWDLYQQFAASVLRDDHVLPPGEPLLFGEQLYWLPHGKDAVFHSSMLEGIRVPRPGLHLATVKKNRVEPSHALALALPIEAFMAYVSLPPEAAALHAYLRGEAIPAPAGMPNGWAPICVDSHPIGWAKCSEGQLKNHYPKGLRRP